MSLDNFPNCLLTETLLWLPLKSVFQCKCISNRWCSLISTPYFTRCYVGHHHTNLQPFTLLFESADILSNRAFTTDSDEPEFKTLASYVHRYNEFEDSCTYSLLWHKWPKDEVPGKMTVYYVINPITRQSLELPPITQPHGFFIQAVLICSYDYNNNNNNIDDKQLNYSVVFIPYLSHKSRKFKIHMFSSNTSEWSELELLLSVLEGFELCHFPRSSVSYRGLLFCCGTGGHLLAFDPYNTRSCRLIEKPIEYESHGGTDCVEVCQGCLRMCQISLWFRLGSVLRVWEFKDYDNGGRGKWFLEHEVFFNQLISKKSPWLTQYVPLKFPFVTVLAFHPVNVYSVVGFRPN